MSAPALTAEEVVDVGNNVGAHYAKDRSWLDLEDTKQQAVLVAIELSKTSLITETDVYNRKSWLGFWVKKRLIDWQRTQKFLYSGATKNKTTHRITHVEFLPEYSGSYTEMGYWLVEELSVERPTPLTAKEKHIQREKSSDELTERQIEILQGYADGLSSKDIALKLYLSYETIKTHKKHITMRLEGNSVTHCVAIAFRRGLLT